MARDLEKDSERLNTLWSDYSSIDLTELVEIAKYAVHTAIGYETKIDRLMDENDMLQEQLNRRVIR